MSFEQAYFNEAYNDEPMTVTCPNCRGIGSQYCPYCKGLGVVLGDGEELPPELMQPERGIEKKYGYNSGDDYVTGGY